MLAKCVSGWGWPDHLDQMSQPDKSGHHDRRQQTHAEPISLTHPQNNVIKDSVQTANHALKTVGTDIIGHFDHLEEGRLVGSCVTFALYLILFICWYRVRSSSNAIPTIVPTTHRPNPALHRSQRCFLVHQVVSSSSGIVEH